MRWRRLVSRVFSHHFRQELAASIVGGAALCATAAVAQGDQDAALGFVRPDPVVTGHVRLRYERADDDGFENAAEALTFRVRGGFETPVFTGTHFLAEFEGIAALAGDYNDAVPPAEPFPVIADAEIIELNRLQLHTELSQNAGVTIGRQRLSLDDQRFVGPVAFRQNEQTFDAVRFEAGSLGPFSLDAAYIRRVNRVFGRNSPVGRFVGDSLYIRGGAASPIGEISGYYFGLDLETDEEFPDDPVEERARRNANSSQTAGVRIDGKRYWGETGLRWTGAYARQWDFADNAVDFTADYWLGAVAFDHGAVSGAVRYESLGGDKNGGAAAFQTPLGTLHLFQGLADIFLTTPTDGIEDVSLELRYRFGSIGPVRKIGAFARGHRFSAQRIDLRYGRELDLGVKAVVEGVVVSAELAVYEADAFASDSRRLWMTLERQF